MRVEANRIRSGAREPSTPTMIAVAFTPFTATQQSLQEHLFVEISSTVMTLDFPVASG